MDLTNNFSNNFSLSNLKTNKNREFMQTISQVGNFKFNPVTQGEFFNNFPQKLQVNFGMSWK